MLSDKTLKKEFKLKAGKEPEKYYAVDVLKGEGFKRKRCSKCGIYFWCTTGSDVCGNPECSGGFRFIGKSPAKNKLGYTQIWKKFAEMFKNEGYTPIDRYPVVARWRTDTDFVQASIYDFQPFVVSGEVEPPANPLVVPQFCLRFNDIDNVGITGAHHVGFVMIGQHAFMKPAEFNQKKYFIDIHNWLRKGLGLPNDEITYHEDAWAGGGNFGPCMEFFSRGVELGNQVYMLYEKTESGPKELKLRVLDMGMGHERNAWFSQGTPTVYDATFPDVMKKLYGATKLKIDEKLVSKFLPYASSLNIDEIEDVHKAWLKVAKSINEDVTYLREQISALAALYSIAEHSRALLVALHDGALPSNTGGGYNLRVILRRALSFVDKYRWNIDLPSVCEWHARELKPLFPELSEHIDDVRAILDHEKVKYQNTKEKVWGIIKTVAGKPITEKLLLQMYDTQGVTPELVREELAKTGKYITVPENFYVKVAELHEKTEQKHATKKELLFDLHDVLPTKALYFDDYEKTEFTAKVVKQTGQHLILDQTCFYPTSGGQLYDVGMINDARVVDVFKQGNVIVHKLEKPANFKHGQEVRGVIDKERRVQLAQHHTTAHIINAAARRVLGPHVNQASAYKDVEKGRIDITHYQALTEQEIAAIEKEANKIVAEKIPLYARFMLRTEAEKTFGMNIYQGGVVPGKQLRIVEIPEVDVEACGGTHLKNTFEAGTIKVLKATKISDGVVRLEYVAGKASLQLENQESVVLQEAAKILHIGKELVPARAKELFETWKDVVKKGKQRELRFTSRDRTEGHDKDVLELAAVYLKTQPEHVPKTLKRFLDEIKTSAQANVK